MATNLYQLIEQSNENSKAVRLGYTVSSYNEVLKELQQFYGNSRIVQRQAGATGASGFDVYGNTPQPIFADRQLQGTLTKIGQHITDDGFVVDAATDYTKFRQQQVMLSSFMSFVMDIDDEDGKGKVTHFVPYESPRQRLNNGESCQGKNTYPAVKPQSGYKDYCKSLAKGVGNENKNIQIGVAVDLTSGTGTVDSFFKRCYPDIYKDGCGGKLAAKGALSVEIAFIEESKTTASTVVARVIADSGESDIGKIHTIYLPVPLMLTNDYRSLVEVKVKDKKGNETTVGSGTCTYPLSKSRFNFRNASLDSFTPKYLKEIVSKEERIHSNGEPKVKFHSKIIDVDGTNHEVAYIRFFIKQDVDLKGIFSTDEIPEAYSKEIYRGLGEMNVSKDIIGYEESGGYGAVEDIVGGENDTCHFVNDVDWEKLKNNPSFRNYYQYKDIIIRECQAENLNVRLMLAHFQGESAYAGVAFTAKTWVARYNPSGMLGKFSSINGVPCESTSSDNIGGDGKSHGKFLKFATAELGIRAHCRWVNRSSYYGVKTKKLKTVNEYAVAMQYGVPTGGSSPSFCGGPNYRCPNYAKNIIMYYNKIPHLAKEQMQ